MECSSEEGKCPIKKIGLTPNTKLSHLILNFRAPDLHSDVYDSFVGFDLGLNVAYFRKIKFVEVQKETLINH